MIKYDPKRLWPIYEKLPSDLKDAIFSEQTADNILDICRRYEINEKEMSELARYVGYVLFGLIKRNEFQTVLEEELHIEKTKAEKVVSEIKSLIFFPLRSSLDFVFQEETITPSQPATQRTTTKTPSKRQSKTRDTYREELE